MRCPPRDICLACGSTLPTVRYATHSTCGYGGLGKRASTTRNMVLARHPSRSPFPSACPSKLIDGKGMGGQGRGLDWVDGRMESSFLVLWRWARAPASTPPHLISARSFTQSLIHAKSTTASLYPHALPPSPWSWRGLASACELQEDRPSSSRQVKGHPAAEACQRFSLDISPLPTAPLFIPK